MTFRILNIGLDRDLLDPTGATEGLKRQRFYAENLPATITHIVKAPQTFSDDKPVFSDSFLNIWACPVPHFTLFPMKAARLAARLIASQQFDLVFAQEPFLSGTAGVRVAKRFDLPLVIGAFSDEVGNPGWKREKLLHRFVLDPIGRRNYARADAIRADSRDVANRLRSLGFPQAQFVPFLITNASVIARPDPEAANVRRTLLDGSEGPLLLTVARLEPVKDIPMMLDAFALVRERMPGAVLAVVGDGRVRDELHAYAQSKNIANVRWLGWLKPPELPAYYQASDVFLLSSRHESSARVLSESMLAGTPVVTTATSGAAEVIEDGATGAITPVGDAAAFANAVIRIASDRQALETMRGRAREMAARTVSAEAVIEGIRTIYSSVTR
jgi:glycosyltransferase involved in cell wall biosynthesis